MLLLLSRSAGKGAGGVLGGSKLVLDVKYQHKLEGEPYLERL